jgi:predicted Zn-dependent peptidase
MQFQHATLANGLDIVAEVNPRALSAAVAFFVRTGARDESPSVSGVSHFLEHMAFKGNEQFSADDVNRIFDEVGARYNASTGEEFTLFYAAILPEYLDRTFELLAALLAPSLRQADFDTEQQVILEEIGMYDDLPAFLAHERAMQVHFGTHPLGQSILGSTASVTALSAEQMRSYHREHYRAGNITLVAAGNVDWDRLLRLAGSHCGDWRAGAAPRDVRPAPAAGGREFVSRPGGLQQHVTQLAPAPAAEDSLRFAAELLAVIVGDESSSRLYWELVDPGHVEAADLSYHEFQGTGTWMTYFCCRPEETAQNMDRVASVFALVNRNGVTPEELAQARSKVASRIVLQGELPMGRLSSLGGNWLYRREYRSVEDDLATVRGVDADDLRRLLDVYPLAATTTVGVGPLMDIEYQ